MNKLEHLIASNKKIVSIQDLEILWEMPDQKKLVEVVKYYLRKGKLRSLRRGLYAVGSAVAGDYSPLEVTQKLMSLSYVSLQTALGIHGITFQYYKTIFCMGTKNLHATVEGQNYSFHKIKEEIFFNSLGVEKKENYLLANPERAVCDILYLYPSFTFDSLEKIDKMRIINVAAIYNNKNLMKRVKELL